MPISRNRYHYCVQADFQCEQADFQCKQAARAPERMRVHRSGAENSLQQRDVTSRDSGSGVLRHQSSIRDPTRWESSGDHQYNVRLRLIISGPPASVG